MTSLAALELDEGYAKLGLTLDDIYRLSVDQYHQMAKHGILNIQSSPRPANLNLTLRSSEGIDAIFSHASRGWATLFW
jgi:hypothetical protein